MLYVHILSFSHPLKHPTLLFQKLVDDYEFSLIHYRILDCGLEVSNGGAPATDGCNMICKGNSTEICGGPNRLNAYNYTGTDLPPVKTPPPPGGGGGGGNPNTPVFPVTSGLPTDWAYQGCFV